MATFAKLTGMHLRKMRGPTALDLTQRAVAGALGVAVVTIAKLEQSVPPRALGSIGERLATVLVTDRAAALELGLTTAALDVAVQKHGLRSWRDPPVPLFWRPQLLEWAARVRTRFPSSIDSQARDLCRVMGVNPAEGVWECDVCRERDLPRPNVAFRECHWCKRAICGSSACGDYVLLPGHDLRAALPVACMHCWHTAESERGMPMGLYGGGPLAGLGSVSRELELSYAALRKAGPARRVDHQAMLERVRATVEYLEAVCTALTGAHKQGRTRTPPPGIPDFFQAAGFSLAQVDAELTAARRLLTRIERDVEQLSGDEDGNGGFFQ